VYAWRGEQQRAKAGARRARRLLLSRQALDANGLFRDQRAAAPTRHARRAPWRRHRDQHSILQAETSLSEHQCGRSYYPACATRPAAPALPGPVRVAQRARAALHCPGRTAFDRFTHIHRSACAMAWPAKSKRTTITRGAAASHRDKIHRPTDHSASVLPREREQRRARVDIMCSGTTRAKRAGWTGPQWLLFRAPATAQTHAQSAVGDAQSRP
jgi:hypothetical protein